MLVVVGQLPRGRVAQGVLVAAGVVGVTGSQLVGHVVRAVILDLVRAAPAAVAVQVVLEQAPVAGLIQRPLLLPSWREQFSSVIEPEDSTPRNSNITWVLDRWHAGRDVVYSMDGLNRLTSAQRS